MRLTAAMVNKGVGVPSFSKGDILRPADARSFGWRRLTHEEQQLWYKGHYEDVKAGRDLPYDSAGESKLAPQDAYIPLRTDRTYEVIRGRATAPYSYRTEKGCCEVVDMLDGTRFFCKRRDMVRA